MKDSIWKYKNDDIKFGEELLVFLGDGYKVVKAVEGEDDDEGGCAISYITDDGRLYNCGAVRWARISDIEKL